uniref:Reverse transcriptase domain-containing protein n=1 Tax=Nicotiana tabacum TaxID=4097 RepID=A0A1S3X2B0_TOBAC|nr:PREDICTED: uncharacterized protein LOC107760514 [Nicotiana tabacum]
MDALMRHTQGEVPCCMLFADDIVLIDKMRGGINEFKLSRTKIEYLECKYSDITQKTDMDMAQLELTEDMPLYRKVWRSRIMVEGYGFERAVEVAYITSLWDIVLPQILCQCEMLCAPDCLVTVNDTDLK